MTLSSLSPTQRSASQVNFDAIGYVRSAKHVTDEAHFSDDLGLDWLDRLELMILIEDEFPDIELSDNDANQI
jgi:acyl carrier protein